MGGPWWVNGPVFPRESKPRPRPNPGPKPCDGAPGCVPPPEFAGAAEGSDMTAEVAEGDMQKDMWLWKGPICL